MKTRTRTCLAACAIALSLAACSSRVEEAPDAPPPGLTGDEATQARALFNDGSCALCHGDSGQGRDRTGPPLSDLAGYWDTDRLAAYLNDPAAFGEANPDFAERSRAEYDAEMPAYDYLSEEELHLLARWLLTL